MSGPYGSAALAYWAAGWRGILPLPAGKKKFPPSGRTGRGGEDVSYPDVYAWTETHGDGNIALRMPHDVIGLDVDAYGDKLGAQTITIHEQMYGPLPATWRSTSREDRTSGIRFYRVAPGYAWPGELDGGGVEIIQRAHRYAVVAPSVHPEGGTYRWYDPDGNPSLAVPAPADLAELPEAWIAGVTGGTLAVDSTKVTVSEQQALGWVASRPGADQPPCPAMAGIIDTLVASPASHHGAMNAAVLTCVRYAEGGHPGAADTLGRIRAHFKKIVCAPGYEHQRTPAEADAEWLRSVKGAVGICIGDPSGPTCDCYGQLSALIVANGTPRTNQDTPPGALSDGTTALQVDTQPEPHRAVDEAGEVILPNPLTERFTPGGKFILDQPDRIPAIWGSGDEVLWAEGESLMIAAPPGVGKTTIAGQVIRGRLGLGGNVLGYPVTPCSRRVLYLAMDRPRQIARSLRRHFTAADRKILDEKLFIWQGPPPADLAKNTGMLAALAELADADTIVIDSVKDAALKLTDDETGASYNQARQKCLAKGIEVLELHHMVKRGADGKPPKSLADVYGSMHLTSGAGSVVCLWGEGGDLLIDLIHVKQPAETIGPLKLIHDHDRGETTVQVGTDLVSIVAASGSAGMTAQEVAVAVHEKDEVTKGEKAKIRRQLDKLVKDQHLVAEEDPDRGYQGQAAIVFRVRVQGTNQGTRPIFDGEGTSGLAGYGHGTNPGYGQGTQGTQPQGTDPATPLGVVAGSSVRAAAPVLSPEGASDETPQTDPNSGEIKLPDAPCRRCTQRTNGVILDLTGGYCLDCADTLGINWQAQ